MKQLDFTSDLADPTFKMEDSAELKTLRCAYDHRRLQEFEVTRARFSGALARRKNFALMISYRVWFHYFSSRDFLRSEKRAHLLGLTSSKISLVTTSLFSLEKCTLYTLRSRINISASQASPGIARACPGLQPLMLTITLSTRSALTQCYLRLVLLNSSQYVTMRTARKSPLLANKPKSVLCARGESCYQLPIQGNSTRFFQFLVNVDRKVSPNISKE